MDRYNDVLDLWTEQEMGSALSLGKYLNKKYKPTSVIDIGCGSGVFLLEFINNDIDTLGVDGEPEGGKLIPNFKQVDLRQLETKEVFEKEYDLAICLEVAEHLHEEYADTFVDVVSTPSNRIIFSAAKPGQVGTNHYNCQTKEYWLEKFAKYGFSRNEEESEELLTYMRKDKVFLEAPWLEDNIMVLKRNESTTS